MARSIKDQDTEQLARTLAERTGESITLATKRAGGQTGHKPQRADDGVHQPQ